MFVTEYKIPGMDCPSEENIIRLSLQDYEQIKSLTFDIAARKLLVYHTGEDITITKKLEQLNFGAIKISRVDVEDKIVLQQDDAKQQKLLIQVLTINASFFVLEVLAGLWSKSMGLLADGLDMLADAFVYGLSLWAIARTIQTKTNIALASGYAQLFLAMLGFTETIRRFISPVAVPDYKWMISISILALLGNAACLYLLQKSKSKEAHMQASMIFTSNDIWVNAGVIVAGVIVLLTNQRWADLVIGSIVFVIVAKGALTIIKLGKAKA